MSYPDKTVYHYDAGGNLIGHSGTTAPAGGSLIVLYIQLSFLAIGVAWAAIGGVFNLIGHYGDYERPYCWIGHWYYCALQAAAAFGIAVVSLFHWMFCHQFTRYPNANLVGSIVVCSVFCVITWKVLSRLWRMQLAGQILRVGSLVFILPAILGLLYFIMMFCIGFIGKAFVWMFSV